METLSMGEAARRVGRTKGTLSKAIATGRLNVVEKTKHGYLIDVDELTRVFPERTAQTSSNRSSSTNESSERDAAELTMLRRENDLLRQQLEDVRADRDAWRDQARRLLPPEPDAVQ